jgi:uncharacterized membrane protein YkvA (DUF1232 family)
MPDFGSEPNTNFQKGGIMNTNKTYNTHYNDAGFWNKVKNHAKKAGKKVIVDALILYFALQDDDTPAWAKSVIIGALGYLITPIDLIPDFKPVIGYSDDAMILAMALAAVAVHVKDQHIRQAHDVLDLWFGASSQT